MSKSLPEKWSRYKNIGDAVVEGTRFFPFKTPLDDSWFDGKHLPIAEKLTMERLMEEINAKEIDLGMVIDLTTSFKYYNPIGWKAYNVEYRKLKCDGKHLMEIRLQFYDIVEEYFSREKNKIIGVHCCHGINRTGFLICAYMVERMGFALDEAVTLFERSRGHQIETSVGKLEELKHFLAQTNNSKSPPSDEKNGD
uniref:Tyrosine specific protein phosphatases domain-containing protein n=1 Tax=Panagrolaimus sp. ES5 TaxID=591445 RepID=A0AC34FAQ2_9BILA